MEKAKTYTVRLRHETGISSPSLYPSLMVFPATDTVENSAPARERRVIVVGNRFFEYSRDILASFIDGLEGFAPRWRVVRSDAEETQRCFCRGVRRAVYLAMSTLRSAQDRLDIESDGCPKSSIDTLHAEGHNMPSW